MSDTTQKRCNACGKEYPATDEFFPRDKSRKDGLQYRCKECKRKNKRAVHKEEGDTPEGYKCCTKCKKVKPATREFFYPDTRYANKLYSRCIACRKERYKQEFGKISVRDYNKTFYNGDQRDYQKTYQGRPDVRKRMYVSQAKYRAHPEIRKKRRSSDRLYRNRADVQERLRIRRSLPETRYKKQVYRHIRRAHKRSVPGTYTTQQILEQLKRQKYRCYYAACGRAKLQQVNGKYIYHIDHTYPLSRVAGTGIPANDISYLVLTCPFCNLSKGSKYPWEWAEGGRLL